MTRLSFTAADGVRLIAHGVGPVDGEPVLLLGGLGQTRHSWRRVAERLASSGRRAIATDLRGHGDSGRAPDGRYGYPSFVADVGAIVAALGAPPVLVGASLGGKIALAAAGYGGPGVARALVMIDTVPRANASGIRQAIAPMEVPREGFASLEEAAGRLAALRDRPVEAGAGERLRRAMRQDAGGRWHWHWDPSLMARDHGLGTVPALDYLERAASRLSVPVLLARAERSSVTDDAGVAAFTALVPHALVETVAGAAHMLVGDANDIFADVLLGFLDARM